VKRGLKIVAVSTVDEVLKLALVESLTPIEWIEPAEVDKVSSKQPADERGGIVTH
jgi:ATP-dependent Lon protease